MLAEGQGLDFSTFSFMVEMDSGLGEHYVYHCQCSIYHLHTCTYAGYFQNVQVTVTVYYVHAHMHVTFLALNN